MFDFLSNLVRMLSMSNPLPMTRSDADYYVSSAYSTMTYIKECEVKNPTYAPKFVKDFSERVPALREAAKYYPNGDAFVKEVETFCESRGMKVK
jgi:hypothetical protein